MITVILSRTGAPTCDMRPYMQLQVHITHMHAHAHARLGLLYSVSSVGAQLCDNIRDSDGH